jgi:CDP-4-dehydro-6-deoxyglucose reductase, E3
MKQIELPVEPFDDVIEAVIQQGLVIPNSCRNGRCGACLGHLVSGSLTKNQPEIFLEGNSDKNAFLACCSKVSKQSVVEFSKLYPDMFPAKKTYIAKIKIVEKISSTLARFRIRMPPKTKFEYVAGQYVGISTSSISERLYSICSYNESSNSFDLLVSKVEGGKMSNHLFFDDDEKFITVNGPSGSFHLPSDIKSDVICYATGSGIAPILSILDKLILENDERIFQFKIHWGYRYICDGNIDIENKYSQVKLSRFCSKEKDPRSSGAYVTDYNFDLEHSQNHLYMACGNPNMISQISENLSNRQNNLSNFMYDNFFLG